MNIINDEKETLLIERDEETTDSYYDSEEGNELLLYDPQDPCIELDEEGYII